MLREQVSGSLSNGCRVSNDGPVPTEHNLRLACASSNTAGYLPFDGEIGEPVCEAYDSCVL